MKLRERTEYLWDKYGFIPQKKLGQNFLIDPGIVNRIIKALKLNKKDTVLEIGAGTGVLTERLIPLVKKVIAIEIDEKLCQILKKEVGEYPNLKIICEDITKASFVDRLNNQREKVKIVGNLPYYLASPLLLELVKSEWLEFMVVMIQREVAERIASQPGSKKRGALTVLINYYAEITKIIDVPPQVFIPRPRVGSTVVKIEKKKEHQARKEERFFRLVKTAFSTRRKMLGNTLSRGLGIEKEIVKETLARAGVEWQKRAEELKVEEFVKISNELYN
jgi:16S rRNA (adenine1518-N6/adenine1519-N6)-dimethyltransferase